MAKLVLTAVGPDRPGLVSALSEAVAAHDGNWLESEMSRLAGAFAGIILIEVGDSSLEAFHAALDRLGADGMLTVTATRLDERGAEGRSDGAAAGAQVTLSLLGQDRPGIVHQVSSALAQHGVTIDELSTATSDAPMGGGVLFRADASLRVPAGTSLDDVTASLEGIADELMVDIGLDEAAGDRLPS